MSAAPGIKHQPYTVYQPFSVTLPLQDIVITLASCAFSTYLDPDPLSSRKVWEFESTLLLLSPHFLPPIGSFQKQPCPKCWQISLTFISASRSNSPPFRKDAFDFVGQQLLQVRWQSGDKQQHFYKPLPFILLKYLILDLTKCFILLAFRVKYLDFSLHYLLNRYYKYAAIFFFFNHNSLIWF